MGSKLPWCAHQVHPLPSLAIFGQRRGQNTQSGVFGSATVPWCLRFLRHLEIRPELGASRYHKPRV